MPCSCDVHFIGCRQHSGASFKLRYQKCEIKESSHHLSVRDQPMVIVKKEGGFWRFCVDNPRRNHISKKNLSPLRHSRLYTCTVFLIHGYAIWILADRTRGNRQRKKAFVTSDSLFEFEAIPFELCNSVVTFERIWTCYWEASYGPHTSATFTKLLRFHQPSKNIGGGLFEVLNCFGRASFELNTKRYLFGAQSLRILEELVHTPRVRPDSNKP